jgi:hypothetical protein
MVSPPLTRSTWERSNGGGGSPCCSLFWVREVAGGSMGRSPEVASGKGEAGSSCIAPPAGRPSAAVAPSASMSLCRRSAGAGTAGPRRVGGRGGWWKAGEAARGRDVSSSTPAAGEAVVSARRLGLRRGMAAWVVGSNRGLWGRGCGGDGGRRRGCGGAVVSGESWVGGAALCMSAEELWRATPSRVGCCIGFFFFHFLRFAAPVEKLITRHNYSR